MNSNVSFYLIAILALHVKCQSLQERDVPENVLIVDHHVKKYLSIFIIHSKYFPNSVIDDQIWKNFVFNEEMTSKNAASYRLIHC